MKETVAAYYKDKMNPKNPDYLIHGWESEEAAGRRFDVLFKAVDLNGKNLLDVGCGTGVLFEEIKQRGIHCGYLGIDILPEMVALAKKRRPEGMFLRMDLTEENPFGENCFDVVYASGIFNLNTGDNEAFLQEMVSLFAKIASDWVIFNLLHERSQEREDTYFYTSPEAVKKLLERARIRSHSLEFIDGYRHNDFTVLMRMT